MDPNAFTLQSRIDVYPGESELLAVAARFDNENESYGFNNESYFTKWRNPKWKLSPGRYLIKVTIRSQGQNCTSTFRLLNDVPRPSFRIEPCLNSDPRL